MADQAKQEHRKEQSEPQGEIRAKDVELTEKELEKATGGAGVKRPTIKK